MRAIDARTLIGDTIAMVHRHFAVFATVSAAFYFVPSVAFGLLFPLAGRAPDPAHPVHVPPVFWLVALVLGLVALVAGFTIAAIAADPAEGGGRTLGATMAGVMPRIGKALAAGLILAAGYFILCFAAAFIFVIVAVIVAVGSGSAAKPPTIDPAMIMTITGGFIVALLPPFFWLYGRLTPLLGVLLREALTPGDSIRRAWALSRGNGWRIAGLQLIIFLPEMAAQGLAWGFLRSAGAAPGDALGVAALVVRTAVIAWLLLYHYAGMAIVYRRLAEA